MTDSRVPPETSSHEHVSCPNCNATYSIPRTEKVLRITCKHCQAVFYKNLPTAQDKRRSKYLIPAIITAIIIIIVLLVQFSAKKSPSPNNSTISTTDEKPKTRNPTDQGATSSNWVTISYAALVDGSTLTHSGETVSEVVEDSRL
jgi:hypothetical protein